MLHTATKLFIPNPALWAQTLHHPFLSIPPPCSFARMHILLPSPLTHITTTPAFLPFRSLSGTDTPSARALTAQPTLISQGACPLPHIALYPLPSEWRWVSSCMYSKFNVLHRSRICTPNRLRKFSPLNQA